MNKTRRKNRWMRGWMLERCLSTDTLDNHVSPGVDAFFMTLPASYIIDSIISRGRVARATSFF